MTVAGRALAAGAALALSAALAVPAAAQEPPSKIGLFVVDLHGTFERLPSDAQLAESRGIALAQLPGSSLGLDIGAHVYLLRWKALTVGLGGQITAARGRLPAQPGTDQTPGLSGVTETFVSAAPQISFNFGRGSGWSYLSGGIGLSQWSIVPEGAEALDADTERLKTINYGGGARWFIKPHLAFSFDVRLWAMNPGTPNGPMPGSPRTTLMIFGAGISVK
jgi:hypothetical protein